MLCACAGRAGGGSDEPHRAQKAGGRLEGEEREAEEYQLCDLTNAPFCAGAPAPCKQGSITKCADPLPISAKLTSGSCLTNATLSRLGRCATCLLSSTRQRFGPSRSKLPPLPRVLVLPSSSRRAALHCSISRCLFRPLLIVPSALIIIARLPSRR